MDRKYKLNIKNFNNDEELMEDFIVLALAIAIFLDEVIDDKEIDYLNNILHINFSNIKSEELFQKIKALLTSYKKDKKIFEYDKKELIVQFATNPNMDKNTLYEYIKEIIESDLDINPKEKEFLKLLSEVIP